MKGGKLKHGDYSTLAKYYVYRPNYSKLVLKALALYVDAFSHVFKIADIGAGTGKLTEQLLELGLEGYAIEPNDEMRKVGIELLGNSKNFSWISGSAEHTGLADSSVDWVVMASSFHWTDSTKALKEFYRILKPEGFLTIMWNPRDIENSDLEWWVEKRIKGLRPNLKRVSSGAKHQTKNWGEILISGKIFRDLIFVESPHVEIVTRERYLNIWKSVNDIQVQLGFKKFKLLIDEIKKKIFHLEKIKVVYNTRAWTAQSVKP